jgi:hypothetical protein
MAISKLRPRFFNGRTLGFVFVAMSASHRRGQDHKSRDPEDGDKDRPFDPDSLCLMLQKLGKQIDDGNAQPIDRMEQDTEEDEDLEGPVLINIVQKAANIPTKEGCKQVHRHENRHPQPADPVQDKRQLITRSPVTQSCPQRDIPLQAHLSLLDASFLEIEHIISFRHFLLKVTILMGYLFQISSKKEGLDLYNPEYTKSTKQSYFTACLINT